LKLKNKGLTISITREEPHKYLAQLVSLYEKAYSNFPEYSYKDLEDIFFYLRGMVNDDNKCFLMARRDEGRIVGFVIADKREDFCNHPVGEIHEIVVDPDYQLQGLGRELFDSACELLRNKGCRYLELCVGRNNEKALSFYLKKGLRQTEKKERWIYMEKEL